MPFGPFKNHAHCVSVVSHKKDPPSDPDAYCAWIERKIKGGDSALMEFLAAGDLDAVIYLYSQHLIDNPEGPLSSIKKLMTKEQAKEVLASPSELSKWSRPQLIDDHRWCHLWAKALKDKKNVFLDEKQLRRLHDLLVQEMAQRGYDSGKNHKTPLEVGAMDFASSPVPGFFNARTAIMLDPEFLSLVGSAVLKEQPRDVDLMLRCPENSIYKEIVLKSLPDDLVSKLDFCWESEPNGPYIPLFELWAIPVPLEKVEMKEPKFDITPLSPILPASPSVILQDPVDLAEDSYYVESCEGVRAMIHRKLDTLLGFGADLEEIDIPEAISAELLSIEDPSTFILDGFITQEKGEAVYRILDMPWWRASQHINQMAETRKKFIEKLPEGEHVKPNRNQYFANRRDAAEFLKDKSGPYLLIPGAAPYPNDGQSLWLLYQPNEVYKLESGEKQKAFLVSTRLDEESSIVCCESPWIALQVRGEKLWSYLRNSDDVVTELLGLGIEVIIGTSLTQELAEKLAPISFQRTGAATIREYYEGKPASYAELEPQRVADVSPRELKLFYDGLRDRGSECMKLSCGGIVPLRSLKMQQNLYLAYPDESKNWKYVIHFHVRELSVHADFRCQVNTGQLIGWTWNIGKSLLKPMLRRTPAKYRVAAGITSEDLSLSGSELSVKLRSVEGRRLRKALSKKVETLDKRTIKQMLNELWAEEMDAVLANPTVKMLTQIKHPMSSAWLDYEDIPAGAVGATSELGGRLYLMDKGRCQFGSQKSYFHEYWLDGARLKKKRMVVRRIDTSPEWGIKQSAWVTFFSAMAEMPYTLTSRAVTQSWMPPKTVSALPQKVRGQIPADRQYWRAENRGEVRGQLIKDITAKLVTLKLVGLQFAVKRVYKGSVPHYWMLLHNEDKVYEAWDFGQNPLGEGDLLARQRDPKEMEHLLKHADISDSGAAQVVKDTGSQFQVKLNGNKLRGMYIFLNRGDTWAFSPASMPESKKAMLMQAASCTTRCSTTGVLHLAAENMEVSKVGDLLFLKGPAIKPGEVLPMDGTPSYFTKEGIKKFWPSMHRQPIVVLHGDMKGDVIGFVNKAWYDEKTGWGWVEGVIWHPGGIALILAGKLPAFSIEVVPESIWDPEHKHDHVIGGECIGLAVVPKGACITCTPTEIYEGALSVEKGDVYKFGMTREQYIEQRYWKFGESTQGIADSLGKSRSTVEAWMKSEGIPRRSLKEARYLRSYREEVAKKYGGSAFITALGTGDGRRRERNPTATLFTVGNDHLLVNAPKGISAMLHGLRPRYILLEHGKAGAGLHELRGIKPIVLAGKGAWAYLRRHYPSLTGAKGEFAEVYAFERRVLSDQIVQAGAFTLKGIPVNDGFGFKINAGGTMVFHVSDASDALDLKGVDVYMGGGNLTEMMKQVAWAREAEVPQILFNQVAHTGMTHKALNAALKDVAPNVKALEDGEEVQLNPGNPGARFPEEAAAAICTGARSIIVRVKPYQEYAKQAIYLVGDGVHALYVEGYPEGPLPAQQVKTEMREEHGMSDAEWKREIGDAESVYIYHPRMLEKFDSPRAYKKPEYSAGPYIHNVTWRE